MNIKIETDDCGDLIVPEVNKEDECLHKDIVSILRNKHFLHEGWIGYGFYQNDAAAYICYLIKEMGYKK